MIGPGKYDYLCTYVREQAEAAGAIVMVFAGKHGQGFSVQIPAGVILGIPKMLREVADEIERDQKRGVI